MKNLIKKYLCIGILGAVVTFGWKGLEILILGTIRPSSIDTIIAIILTLSLYVNFKTYTKSNLNTKRSGENDYSKTAKCARKIFK